MCKKLLLSMLLCLACVGLARAQEELTVYGDGTATSSNVPVYGTWADAYLKCEFVIPADQLEDMAGGTISQMTYYLTTSATAAWTGTFQVFLKEVDYTSINSYSGTEGATIVYEGNLDATGSTMDVVFTEYYTYEGSNLLVGVYQIVPGNYKAATFAGASVTGACVQGYNRTSLDNVTATQRNFIPRTTFSYVGVGAGSPLLAMQNGAVVGTITVGNRPNGAWMKPFTFQVRNKGENTTVSLIDFTPENYFTVVSPEIPFSIDNNEIVNMQLATGTSTNTEWQMAVFYGEAPDTVTWTITAEPYNPAVKDVWETAYEVTSFPFTDSLVVANIPLYNNYNLPPTDIEDGADAVYKLVFDQDVSLTASLTSGENGKIALYPEGFMGVGGPDTGNNYTGNMMRGHNRDIVEIGTGTNLYYHYPINMFFNYSLTEELYTPEEIGTAGTINAISFYYDYSNSFDLGTATFYMKNVTRESFSSNLDMEPLSSSDIVWSGTFSAPGAGWMTITLDTPFAYDGTSNLLVAGFEGNSGYPGSAYKFRTTPCEGYKGIHWYSDSYTPDPYNTASGFSGSKSYTQYRANIRLDITPANQGAVTDMTVPQGTYYLAASSTSDAWGIEINAIPLACPEMASNPTPANNATELTPTAVQLQWSLGERTTEYKLLLGTDYENMNTVVDWTRDLAESYLVTGLLNNTNYFWQIIERNDGCPDGIAGPVWEFSTLLNGPQDLYASLYDIYEGDNAYLEWTSVADPYILSYNIYQDNVLIGNSTTNNFTVSGLTYNLVDGYNFHVTAVYAGGESNPSYDITIWVSGNGTVAGHVYEQDGVTGIENATVIFSGYDEFYYYNTYSFTTDANGYYSGDLKAGNYNATAICGGYQNSSYNGSVSITNDVATEGIDFAMDEVFFSVGLVSAEYYPDATDPYSPYVKVAWSDHLSGWHTYAESEFYTAWGSNAGIARWAYEYPVSVLGNYIGCTMTKVSLFSDNLYNAVGGNYTCTIYRGGNEPMAGEAISTITVDVPQGMNAWVDFDLTTPVDVTGTENLWVVWAANTHLSNWPAGCSSGTNSLGSWWNLGVENGYGWTHQSGYVWSMRQYFSGFGNRGFYSYAYGQNDSDIPSATISPMTDEMMEASTCVNPNAIYIPKGTTNNRSFSHYRVYRTDAYNDGPYTEDNTVLLADDVIDTLLIDNTWSDAEPGVYKFGVSRAYEGNRGGSQRAIVEIGSGDYSAVAYPVNFLWAYTENQMILTADEIGTSGWITSVAYKRYDEGSGNLEGRNIDIYMMHTSMDNYASTADWIPVTASDLVYSGIYYFQTTGEDWQTITLDTPFEYNGVDNLCICIDDNTGFASTRQYWSCHTTPTNRGMRAWGGSDFDPTAAGAPSNQSSTNSYVADIQLNVEPLSIQMPRESEIVWSEPMDKNMYLANGDVNVTVTLNSGDSPEGVLVQFTNLNPTEQALYPVTDLVMDATGYYAFDSFRRGDYQVQVSFNDYYTVTEEIGIWDATALNYLLEEINHGVTHLYVSKTGWAKWNDVLHGNTVPSLTFEPSTFFVDFEDGLPTDWTMIDANNDGRNWMHSDEYTYSAYANMGHNASYGFALSQSYDDNAGAITPDNYLVSPLVNFSESSTFAFWATNSNNNWGAEHFGVAISTSGNTNPDDFTTIAEWTLLSKGEKTDGERQLSDGVWYEKIIDLSAYAGQSGYIAIRHFNCNDQWLLCVDDLALTNGAKGQGGAKHFEQYQMVCTDAEDNVIFDITTSNCYNQLPTDNLVDGETYHLKVAEVYSSGLSEWSETDWMYQSCDNFETVTELNLEMNSDANVLSWTYPAVDNRSSYQAYVCNNGGGAYAYGWLSFDIDNPSNISVSNSSSRFFGGDYCGADGYVYSSYNQNWYKVNSNTGEIVESGSSGLYLYDCAWDYSEQKMYAIASATGLYEWNVIDKEFLYIGSMNNAFEVLACDLGGQLYGIAIGGDLYRINKTDASIEYVGSTGLSCDYYYQSGGFDHYTEKMYWYGQDFFAEVDTETGLATVLLSNTGSYNHGTFCVPYTSFTDVLGAMLYRDGELLGFTTETSYTDTIATGNHEYEIRVVYDGPSVMPNHNVYYSMSCPQSIGGATYEVTVAADPEECGVATGSGSFINGFPCTITATPNPGYLFINWTINGEVVSTEPTYTFPVHENADCVAHFSYGQIIPFANGWNWMSSYVELSNIDGLGILETGLGDIGVQIQSQDAYVINYNGYWMGMLESITNEQTYMVQTNDDIIVEICGPAAQTANHPITMNEGWNWIGYPVNASMTVNEAFATFIPTDGDQVKSQGDYAIYYDGYGWMGDLDTITPNMGLMYHSATGGTFTYPEGTRVEKLTENGTKDGNHWTNDIHAYPTNMTMLAVVELDGEEVQSERYELAAFADNEVRGSAKLVYVQPIDRYVAFLTIAGDEAVELYFGLYNEVTGEEIFDCDDHLTYTTNAIVGNPDEPAVIHFRGTTGLDDFERNMHVYPNPVARGERFSLSLPVGSEVRIEIVNALGVTISDETSTKAPATIKAPKTSGIYTLRITVEGKGTYSRKLVVR